MTVTAPAPPLRHLLRLTDRRGVFEHADGSRPRVECGYCVDDVARALIVVCRQPAETVPAGLGRQYLDFVAAAQTADGRSHNRLSPDGRWVDEPGLGDWWGRALWAFGTAAARSGDHAVRAEASHRFAVGTRQRSVDRRAMAFAALGAAEILNVDPTNPTYLSLMTDAVTAIGRPNPSPAWPWPEPRLTYANAALPEALLAAGTALSHHQAVDDGLTMLRWLVEQETRDGHLSVVGVGGWRAGEPRPMFDQQPIEVAAIADACHRAWRLTGDSFWASTVDLAVAWFLGDNDSQTSLLDANTGGGRDAITPTGCNTNQGAESTLALIATLQYADQAPGELDVGCPRRR